MFRAVLFRSLRVEFDTMSFAACPDASTVVDGRDVPSSCLSAGRSRLLAGVSALLVAWAVLGNVSPAIAAVETGATGAPAEARENMVVEADQVIYDTKADTVTAIGNVHIYYASNALQARRVVYDRKSRKVLAEGDARLIDKDGNVMTSPSLDVSEGFSEGFVKSLRIETVDRSRFAAESAKRSDGSVTVFEKGVYSACQTCVNEPAKPPFWQIKAVRIIHDQQEKTIYYEDAKLEMLGVPIAWVPYFKHPDPSVKRRTGFTLPRPLDSSTLGVGVQVPFYWAPTEDWDATLSPVALSRQGVLGDVEVRHSFDAGIVTVRALGIRQNDPHAFVNTSGDRDQRGAFTTTGKFTINQNWKWGWDATFVSDRRFFNDYHISSHSQDQSTTTVFLTGQGLKTWFDTRLYKFTVFNDDFGYDSKGNRLLWGAGTNLQDKQPIVGVADYDIVAEHDIAGGEVSAHFNATSLTRNKSDVDTVGRVYGLAGTFSRVSGIAQWRRQFIDDYGQVITPFASLRADVFYNRNTDHALANFVDEKALGRVTPTIGVDYRYPFIATTSWGSHTLEPIAQIVARPNEQWMGKLPNEDAQSVVFDDTTLFRPDKFSGWDRAEGGTRLNLGAQYTFHGLDGESLSALFGRSYQVAGSNSYSSPDYETLLWRARHGMTVPLTAFGSGLETSASDWVGRVSLASTAGYHLGAQGRFASGDFKLNRADINASGTSGPVSASVTWAYQKTPQVLYDLLEANGSADALAVRSALKSERSEIQTAANLRLTPTWRLFGGIRYDLKSQFRSGDHVGIGYDNDSFSVSLSYSESIYSTVNETVTPVTVSQVNDKTIYLRFGFRTLGDGELSNSASN